ncbi:MAG: hypothetical protein ACREPS_04535, partial [Rhodanobacteraceae bacterium]
AASATLPALSALAGMAALPLLAGAAVEAAAGLAGVVWAGGAESTANGAAAAIRTVKASGRRKPIQSSLSLKARMLTPRASVNRQIIAAAADTVKRWRCLATGWIFAAFVDLLP